jgi:hypothetical protein
LTVGSTRSPASSETLNLDRTAGEGVPSQEHFGAHGDPPN